MPQANDPAIAEVLAFWFAADTAKNWFAGDPAFDAKVRAHLGEWHEMAAREEPAGWRDSAAGCVALCILLDQVPRNLFRGEARAFATDAEARAIAGHALERGFDRNLPQAQRLFLYLPFEHSESLTDQNLAVRLTAELDEEPLWHDYAIRHRDIIARFGRFPHRNAALGRDTTPEESAFLAQPGSSF